MDDVRVIADFPRRVREIENAWITMPDGVRLAACIWLPDDADTDPVPAILEYLPYRKRDLTAERDALTHPYFAGHGYAGVRVDMRGSGDSEGLCKGEYLAQELDDGLAVIAWLAEQPWCSGPVGMIGISWGGFNGLQLAALRPPALKAIVTVCSTDDRYADDVHYLGGAQHGDNLIWGATAWAISMTPPDPAIVGPEWRQMWEARLNGNGIWMHDWFAHQRRDDFYRHGSICGNYADIQIPVYAVGGWVDGYPNAIFRMMQHLPGPKKALIGPWGHTYPHFALPGPRIGFLQECLRWWDQHLKGHDTGIMAEPMLRAWMQDPVAPAPIHLAIAGRWVAEDHWAGGSPDPIAYGFAPGRMISGIGNGTIEVSSRQTTGLTAGAWCGYGSTPMRALDQRAEDDAVVFDSEPLAGALELLGWPELELAVQCDKPTAIVAVTLSAIAADGAATRVSYGILNLSHRYDDDDIVPMQPGRPETVCIKLRCLGQRLEAGQRLRLAISTAYWPIVFPAPEVPVVTIDCASMRLTLPGRQPKPLDARLPAFAAPETAPPLVTTVVVPARPFKRQVVADQITGEITTHVEEDAGTVRHAASAMTLSSWHSDSFTVHPDDPATARGTSRWIKTFGRDAWQTRIEMTTTVHGLRDNWRIETRLLAHHGHEVVLDRSDVRQFARELN